ncbi:deoxyribodipyrimidine photo-lyase [Luteolibacter pohnpeiensis]|uniref:Deoxyribodipyrimidine photo-lyase n=1 Tax=Luteolibacter pohnpeiensis TaxID=454153 RepID=A0A934S7H0_9BACT|nr:deoxyribodipyrimidine photo-lyase [Luteolibacter pohnpeiensis]MBK1883258.1 deoxyribodipyrimidine photo-lyase [Luteolibacter pohnpeiensis]
MPKRDCVIHWFRRDLRISDNTALWHAAKRGLPVVPVYIRSEWKNHHAWTGSNRQAFLCGSLESLAKNLQTLAGELIIRKGEAVNELATLIQETGAKAIFYNSDPDPFGKKVEAELRDYCSENGIECCAFHDVTLHAPGEVLTKSEQPYRVFTPYSKSWLELEKPSPHPKPGPLHTPSGIHSLELPTIRTWGLKEPEAEILTPGEHAARQRLKSAISGTVQRYQELRDLPAEEATSRLSQDLRFGLISIRTVYQRVMQARETCKPTERKNIDTFIKELAWREFYMAILHHFPDVLKHEFNEDWRGLPWNEPGESFEAWKEGKTGFPIIDAGMRQLKQTGFMHNRVRMITAMFLTKDLHLDWKLGESWFMQHLVDGEIASNNGGWQWSAGTGADAAPYFRIQNPWTQTERYDPAGKYIKRWVEELKDVPAERFMAPPKNGRPIADGYPLPIVDHKTEREKTLAIFKKHRPAKH